MREPGSGKRVRQTSPYLGRLVPPPQIGSSDPSADRLQQQRHRQSIPTEPQAPEVMGVYVISVAARIVGVHAQTLRHYERVGLIWPSRTVGRQRLYSMADIDRLRRLKALTEDMGINLAGAEVALKLMNRIEELEGEVERLTDAVTMLQRQGLAAASRQESTA